MKCAICYRKAKGYGWFNPRLKPSDPNRYSNKWVFCSRRCQDAFCLLMTKTEARMIDPSDMELAAMRACLSPLGEYVGSIGMERPLADYTREEVLTLIDVVVTVVVVPLELVKHKGSSRSGSTASCTTASACRSSSTPAPTAGSSSHVQRHQLVVTTQERYARHNLQRAL